MLRTRAGRSSTLRLLTDRERDIALTLCERDPVANVFVSSRIRDCGLDPLRLGAQVWGYYQSGQLVSMCYSGANLVPVEAKPEAVAAFAERARTQGRRCSSIAGPAEPVNDLWNRLAPFWGRPREIRPCQPVMAISCPPKVEPDPAVRPVRAEEVPILYPASIAMFTEEVGVSPLGPDGGAAYRARVAELVACGRSFARIVGQRVLFKADVGAVTPYACQVQGVWVPQELRNHGLATHGMAAVVSIALRDLAPMVSLYVNDFNAPALTAYRKVGFTQVGTFSSVLF